MLSDLFVCSSTALVFYGFIVIHEETKTTFLFFFVPYNTIILSPWKANFELPTSWNLFSWNDGSIYALLFFNVPIISPFSSIVSTRGILMYQLSVVKLLLYWKAFWLSHLGCCLLDKGQVTFACHSTFVGYYSQRFSHHTKQIFSGYRSTGN